MLSLEKPNKALIIRKVLEEAGASDEEIAQTLGVIRAFNFSEPIIYLEEENDDQGGERTFNQ